MCFEASVTLIPSSDTKDGYKMFVRDKKLHLTKMRQGAAESGSNFSDEKLNKFNIFVRLQMHTSVF